MNAFINFVKRFLMGRETRGGMGVSRHVNTLVGALLLPILDLFAEL